MNFFRPICRVLAAAALALAATAPAQAANTAFSGAAVAGCSGPSASQTYSCTSLPLPNYNDTISIASGYTVAVSSAVSFGYNQGLTMSGTAALQTSGDLDISGINPSNLAVSGGTLTTSGTFSIGAQAQTITANITAASMNIGTGSATKITGSLTSSGTVALSSNVTIVGPISGTTITTNSPVSLTGNVTASTAFTLASGSSLVGNITAPTVTLNPSSVTVKGNIAAATSLSIGSGNTVNGSVSGGALTLSPSSASIIGNVNMTGDVDLGSGDNITGNLTAHNVTTESSNAYISGNASVSGITFNYGGYVGGTITCTAPGASGCSCVNNTNSGRAAPTCSAAPAAGPDHILITQSGSGLTCQPASVTLTACANAACSSNYSGNVAVTLTTAHASGQATTSQPVQVTGTASVSVPQTTPDTLTFSASSSASNPYICQNTGSGSPTSCSMVFSDAGFLISSLSPAITVGNFVSGNTVGITISAFKKASNGTNAGPTTCQSLFSGQQTVNLSCAYVNPNSGSMAATVNSTSLAGSNGACSSSGVPVSLPFNSSGVATTTLSYSDVGQLTLAANYQPATGAPVSGTSNAFTVAPASFGFVVAGNPKTTTASGTAFMRAGLPFSISLSALNSALAVTPNFGKEGTAESFKLSTKLTLSGSGSAVGNNQPAGDLPNPTMMDPSTWTLSKGVFTNTAMTWNEVGSFELDAALSNAQGYLGSGLTATGSVVIGRFIPDHFVTTINTTNAVPMPCKITAPVTGIVTYSIAGCPGSNLAVYSGQPFAVQLVAMGAPDSTGTSAKMSNYYGILAKSISFTSWDQPGLLGTIPHPGATSDATAIPSTTPPAIPVTQFSAGTATPAPALGVPQTISYNFVDIKPADKSQASPTVVYLRALDADLLAMTTAVTNPVASAGASPTEPALLVVSGALLVSNNYGAEVSPTPVKLKAQYWNGTAYTNSITDNSTNIYKFAASNILFTNCTLHLANGGAAGVGQSNCIPALILKPAPIPVTFSNGQFTFLLAAPGSGNNGSADISIDNTVMPFLPSISGRTTFGVYRSGPVIYLREVY